MPTTELEAALLRRLGKLERETQSLKVLTFFISLLLIFLIVIGAKGTEHIVAEEIVTNGIRVVDKKGTVRVGLVAHDDFTGLMVADSSGAKQASVGTTTIGPSVAVYDASGQARAALNFVKDTAGYALYEASGQISCALVGSAKVRGLYFYNPGMKLQASLSATSEGSSKMALYDAKNIIRAAISVGDSGPLFTLFGEDKKTLYKKP